MFFPRHLTLTGRSHTARHETGQDASFALETKDFAVVAVADGVGAAKMSQVGSGLIVRTAVYAILEELPARPYERAGEYVREALLRVLRDVVRDVGRQAARDMLPSTLVLGILHDNGADVWAAGDGEGCIVAPEGTLVSTGHDVLLGPFDFTWRKGGKYVRNIPYELLKEPEADIPARVLSVRGRVHGMYVGTDGFAEAEGVREILLRDPEAKMDLVRPALIDANTRDDVSVAWAGRVLRMRMRGESVPETRPPPSEARLARWTEAFRHAQYEDTVTGRYHRYDPKVVSARELVDIAEQLRETYVRDDDFEGHDLRDDARAAYRRLFEADRLPSDHDADLLAEVAWNLVRASPRRTPPDD